ncbi:MAG: DUF493 family protein [Bacteroidetes bacterium]|nr:DUF493 family protein [Bacteroidota bacterium]MDA0950998.1 DUF493 family protein [Bacteroidota bacterium]
MSASTEDDFYAGLKQKLNEHTAWPSIYLFKFIVKAEPEKIELLTSIFEKEKRAIELKPSKNGNYLSFSLKTMMLNADSVIEKYKMVGKIKGVIAL